MTLLKSEPVRAAGVILFSQNPRQEFLLMRHADRWDLPKGHCEPAESFLEAALRELEEETGIPADAVELDPGFAYDLHYPVRDRHRPDAWVQKQVRFFLGTIQTQPTLRLTEHLGAEWIPWEPPHAIQQQTIDPLLAAVERHWRNPSSADDGDSKDPSNRRSS